MRTKDETTIKTSRMLRKRSRHYCHFAVVSLLLAVLTNCGMVDDECALDALAVLPVDTTISVGATVTLTANATPSSAFQVIVWQSSC